MIALILILGTIIGFGVWIYWPELFIGAGWSPTPLKTVRKMLQMAKVKSDDLLYDLGCGDGRIIKMATSEFGAKAVGIEADPLRFLFSLIRIKITKAGKKAKVIWGNFFNINLEKATVITVFLSREVNEKLKEKFQKELRPGTRIISYYWVFPGWRISEIDESHQIYLYKIGEHK